MYQHKRYRHFVPWRCFEFQLKENDHPVVIATHWFQDTLVTRNKHSRPSFPVPRHSQKSVNKGHSPDIKSWMMLTCGCRDITTFTILDPISKYLIRGWIERTFIAFLNWLHVTIIFLSRQNYCLTGSFFKTTLLMTHRIIKPLLSCWFDNAEWAFIPTVWRTCHPRKTSAL